MSNETNQEEIFRNIREGFSEFGKKVSSMMDGVFSGEEGGGEVRPRSDVYTYQGEYLIEVELPGVKKEEVHIQIYEGVLSVKGQKNPVEYAQQAKYEKQERSYGYFLKTFTLPLDVELDKIKAKFDAGILTIRLARPSAVPEPEPEPESEGPEIKIE